MNGTPSLSSVIMKNSPIGLVVIDADTRIIVDVNTAACFLFGAAPEEIIGAPCVNWLCTEKNKCPILDEAGVENIDNQELNITRRDGSILCLLGTATSILWEERQHIVVTLINITEKKKLEDSYADLVKFAPAGIYELDLKTFSFSNVNELMLDFTGYTENEFKSLSAFDLLTESSRTIFVERMRHVMVGEEVPTTAEFEIVTKTGETLWVLLNSRWIYNGSKIPIKAFCVVTNITVRKKAEQALIEAKNKAQLYLDLAHNVFVALDVRGKITLINRAGCDILGIDECFLLGQDWFENYIPPEERKRVRDYFNKSMEIGFRDVSITTFENQVLTVKGERRLIKWRNKTIFDVNGVKLGSFSSGEDITEERRLEEETKRLWTEAGLRIDDALRDLKKLPVTGISTKDIVRRQVELAKTLSGMQIIK